MSMDPPSQYSLTYLTYCCISKLAIIKFQSFPQDQECSFSALACHHSRNWVYIFPTLCQARVLAASVAQEQRAVARMRWEVLPVVPPSRQFWCELAPPCLRKHRMATVRGCFQEQYSFDMSCFQRVACFVANRRQFPKISVEVEPFF